MIRNFTKCRISAVFLILLLTFACAGGYRGDRHKLSAGELKITNQIEQLAEETDGFVKQAPADLSNSLNGLSENTQRLKNNSLRFGPASLEARDALDKVRYHADRIERVVTKEKYPDLVSGWQKIRTDIDSISTQLGYRVGKSY